MTALANETRPLMLGTILFIGILTGLVWLMGEVADWVFAVLKATR
jgi:hypothetical protein